MKNTKRHLIHLIVSYAALLGLSQSLLLYAERSKREGNPMRMAAAKTGKGLDVGGGLN